MSISQACRRDTVAQAVSSTSRPIDHCGSPYALYHRRFDSIGRETTPAITHPEFYYDFLSVALACQVAFLVIAADPIGFRPMMAVAIVEKFGDAGSIAVHILRAASPLAISGKRSVRSVR